jgi:CheY-like chemotaxis protein
MHDDGELGANWRTPMDIGDESKPGLVPSQPSAISRSGAESLATRGLNDIDHKPKVLVVDDEHVIADTLAIILNQAGFDTKAAYDGKEAVDVARRWSPKMMICDVIMPEMNGFEAAICIREFLPECRILHFSGQAATVDLLENARIRGHEFTLLFKPVYPQYLLAWLIGVSDSVFADAVTRAAAEKSETEADKAKAREKADQFLLEVRRSLPR